MSVESGSVNTHMPNVEPVRLTGVHLAVILVATAMIAADRYYCQPLLAEMSRTLHLTPVRDRTGADSHASRDCLWGVAISAAG
jgi:hypothetical protein